MDFDLIEKIKNLAEKYETADFLKADPSQFMHRYSEVRDKEAVAFLAANLAFGNRKQILSHVEQILSVVELSGKTPSEWILSGAYNAFCENRLEQTFYRMYTYNDLLLFFDTLSVLLKENATIGDYFKAKYENSPRLLGEGLGVRSKMRLHTIIADSFPVDCKMISHSKDGAAKKLNMLLRWLVRDNSPVDLGLWTWYDKKNLLIPLDTHVMQVAQSWNLITGKSANLKTAVELSEKMKLVFPSDPTKADFALFGLGVNKGDLP